MAFRKPDRKRPSQSAVSLAIAVVEGRPKPLDDSELAAVDPAPINLNLQDCRFEGRFDPSFRTPANLADS
jgi:hypothetical protein